VEDPGDAVRDRYGLLMDVRIWATVAAAAGLVGIGTAALVEIDVLPAAVTAVSIGVVPLVALFAAFVGLGTGAYVSASLTAAVAIAAPIVDMTARSFQAGNFDDARLVGLGTGVAILTVGIASVIAGARRTPARFARRLG
jgi:hypothetical protein